MARQPNIPTVEPNLSLPDSGSAAQSTGPSPRRKWLLFGGGAAALVLICAGLWLSGAVPHLLGLQKPPVLTGPVYVKIPEIVANLNVPTGQDSYVKIKATLELPDRKSARITIADMPRVIDVFQTYLRAMRPAELRGASGTYRLREALIDRVRVAVAPAEVKDVLFQEMIVQ